MLRGGYGGADCPNGRVTAAAVTFVSAFCNARGRVSAAERMRPVEVVGSSALVPFGKNTDLEEPHVGGGLAPPVSESARDDSASHADGPATAQALYDKPSGPGADAFARRRMCPKAPAVGNRHVTELSRDTNTLANACASLRFVGCGWNTRDQCATSAVAVVLGEGSAPSSVVTPASHWRWRCGIHARSHACVRAALWERAGAVVVSLRCPSSSWRRVEPVRMASRTSASRAGGSGTSKSPSEKRTKGRAAGHRLQACHTAFRSARWMARVSCRARCAVALGVCGPARKIAFRAAAAALRSACLVRRHRSGGAKSWASSASTRLRANVAYRGCQMTHGGMAHFEGATAWRRAIVVTMGV